MRDKLKSQYSFSEEQIRWCNNFIESNYCSEVSANLALCNTWRSLVQIKKKKKKPNKPSLMADAERTLA